MRIWLEAGLTAMGVVFFWLAVLTAFKGITEFSNKKIKI